MSKLFLALLALAFASVTLAQEADTSASTYLGVTGPYLGQEPPGLEPRLFASDLMQTDGVEHCFPAFSADGREVYWMRADMSGERPRGEIWFMRDTDSGWAKPALAPFSGEHSDHAPVFSHDGQRLYFASSRPGGVGPGKNLWFVERTAGVWGEATHLGSPPNTDIGATQQTFTTDGTVYFSGILEGVQWNIGVYRSRLVEGEYQAPELLPDFINTEYADAYPFIAPDESYLLFGSSRPGGRSVETDLYVSFRRPDDTWTGPIHLGEEINNGLTVSFSFVTYDGKYLFFDRFDEETDRFYWVDARILDKYRPEDL